MPDRYLVCAILIRHKALSDGVAKTCLLSPSNSMFCPNIVRQDLIVDRGLNRVESAQKNETKERRRILCRLCVVLTPTLGNEQSLGADFHHLGPRNSSLRERLIPLCRLPSSPVKRLSSPSTQIGQLFQVRPCPSLAEICQNAQLIFGTESLRRKFAQSLRGQIDRLFSFLAGEQRGNNPVGLMDVAFST